MSLYWIRLDSSGYIHWYHCLTGSSHCVCWSLQETVVQLSRMGVGAGIGELVEGAVVRVGADDGDSLDEYDSDVDVGMVFHSTVCGGVHFVLITLCCVCVAKAVDKSPTAVDFADITELAEEGEGEEREGLSTEGLEDQERNEMFQKGMAFAQAQLSGML